MHMLHRIPLLALLAAALIACDSDEPADDQPERNAPQGRTPTDLGTLRQDAARMWDDLRTYSIEQKNKLVEAGGESIEMLDAQYARLEARAREQGGKALEAWQKLQTELDTQLDAARTNLDRARDATATQWDTAKTRLADGLEQLSGKLQHAAAELRDDRMPTNHNDHQ
jgi:uncharacterized protein YukE